MQLLDFAAKHSIVFPEAALSRSAQEFFTDEVLGAMDSIEIRRHSDPIAFLLAGCADADFPQIKRALLGKGNGRPETVEALVDIMGQALLFTRSDEGRFLPRLQAAVWIAYRLSGETEYAGQLLLNKARSICANEDVFSAVCRAEMADLSAKKRRAAERADGLK